MFTAVFWKKAWVWTKHHWHWPVIIVLLLFSTIANAGVREKLFELLLKQKENYEKELEIIEKTTKEKELKKDKAVEEYQEELKKIETEHDLRLEDLEEDKRVELIKTIEKNKNRPDNLAKEIAKVLNARLLEEE